ncbi:ATPase family AAA domain-containing protein 5-like isoform X2 [Dendroctonus ponderosae]|uniref:ATPase family AAA domain-containing protein 5 isoform X2 n=1 Tax=Dendroctonus ponderosae TaxID=77166 RepID=UPI0020360735|nr:ATPase family AAA domain-containing protein 5 isoform X2 [Dendroctonus ponderosae]XP_048521988.1 ATPase family AAA domain-containing protein 5-like isoform X2 [Dendroctonus ponderosae]
MKDITHYFPSPNKVGSSPESAISPNSQGVPSGSTPKIKNGANKSASPRIKTKRKRKPTDPEVRKQEVVNGESSNSTVDHNTSPPVPDDNESNNVECDGVAPSTPIVNAFQFLMESRNNIIGSNSCASSKSESESTCVIDKFKLKARRRLLEEWADKNGASKRKRDEQEIDSCISLKLEKRAKRLRNMLRADELKVQESNKSDKSRINSSLCGSDSECSNDLTLREYGSKSLVNATQLSDSKSSNSSTSNSPSHKRLKVNGQNNLLNFFEALSKENSSSELNDFDESPNSDAQQVIKMKMFTPSSSSPKNGRTSMSTSGSSPDEVKSKPPRKKHISGSSQRSKRSCKTRKGIVKSNKGSPKLRKNSTKKSSISVQHNTTCAKILTNNQPQLESINVEETAVVEAGGSRDLVVSPILERRSLRMRRKVDYKETKIELPTSVNKSKKQSYKKLRNIKADNIIGNIELLSESDNKEENKKVNTSIKLAPVFLKSTPKPKLDLETIQARKQFLLSGIPDSLKKTVEKQKSVEEKVHNIFPVISHVQQKCESRFWNLPFCDIPQLANDPLQIDKENLKCSGLIIKELPYEIQLTTAVDKIANVKSVIQKMKADNPDYPVFKVFRQLYERSGKHFLEEKKKPRKQSQKSKRKSQDFACEEDASKKHELWIDKYKPRMSDEILANHHGVVQLRKWLEIWKNYSQEINSKKRRRAFNSDSEFESIDCDSRDSTYLPGNTVILHGPCGSGKTSAVYAVANEFNFNVLELNASTRRTGKILLQELKEATRSHQVRHESSVMESTNQQKSKKLKKKKCQTKEAETGNHQKMCILLLEDIDLLFDQDEGFLSSLSHLIMTSKRPIILTTTDKSPPHVQKLMNQYECISFTPLSPRCLAVWLQILCLIEGLLTDRDELGNLLQYNIGDIRKTLLQLQFWAQSGGQLERNKEYPLKAGGSCKTVMKIRDEDCSVGQTDIPEDLYEQKQFIHRHSLGSFEIFRVNKEYLIPQNIDLGNIWWNIPNILDVPSCSSRITEKRAIGIERADPDSRDNQKMKSLSGLYDYLSLSDSLLTTVNSHVSNEPFVNRSVEVLNSLELTERKEDGNAVFAELFQDMCHTLVNESIENYMQIYMTRPTLDMGMPDTNERRWRANLHLCEDFLKQPIPLSNVLNRKSTALDYLPSLRHIARSEKTRAATNTKRGNRFRHYFKGLNMQFKASTCELACNCLNME